jgi:hypothetical protein
MSIARFSKRSRLALVTLLLAAIAMVFTLHQSEGDASFTPPTIKHVFVVVLENENADTTFGSNSAAPYLAKTMASQGAFLRNYYATGHASLDNYISMISGQAPSDSTKADCTTFIDFTPGTPDVGGNGQVDGNGCVYPAAVPTIANSLDTAGQTWKAYMEDMAAKNTPAEPATCRHPTLGGVDNSEAAEVGDEYATRHDPFMYFHSIIDNQASCDANVVDYSHLGGDLSSEATTPDYSFITPNLCDDGHDSPCADGRPGGLTTANTWLKTAIPAIVNSPAYKDHGLLIVTFDEAVGDSIHGDASACCGEQTGPNVASPGGVGPGGGRTGAVLLSPCIASATADDTPYNHYSMLKSVEDLLGVPELGYSADAGLDTFGSAVYTDGACDHVPDLTEPPAPAPAPAPKPKCKKSKSKHGKKKKKCKKHKKKHHSHKH